MKKILLFLFISSLFAFEVQFTKIYTKYIIPKKSAIFIQTKQNNLSFPFKYVKTNKGYILIGDNNKINMWLDNEFYAPKDAKFKTLNIAFINSDAIQYHIIKKIKKEYKSCKIKTVIFLSPDQNILITKPKTIKFKYKVILKCK